MNVIRTMAILAFIFCHSLAEEEDLHTKFIKCEYAPFEKKERGKLDDSYKERYKYKRSGYVAHCDDSLSGDYIEVDPRPCPMLDGVYSVCLNYSVDDKLAQKCEKIEIYKNNDGKKRTMKEIYCKNFKEKIVEIHDKKDSLLFSKHYKWDGKMLIQTIDDGVVRNIIPGKTPCYFTIVEPSGDSVSFKLNPKQRISGSIKDGNNFSTFMNGKNLLFDYYKERHDDRKYGEHDAIIYHWHSFCKEDPDLEILAETNDSDSSSEEELDTSAKDGNSSSPYKYYAMIAVCVTIAGIVVVRKRRKGGK